MTVFRVAAICLLLAGTAQAQTEPVQKYGDPDKEKTAAEKESERQAERAYRRSLGNVPEARGATDPWGGVRNDAPPKDAKAAKRVKPATKTN